MDSESDSVYYQCQLCIYLLLWFYNPWLQKGLPFGPSFTAYTKKVQL